FRRAAARGDAERRLAVLAPALVLAGPSLAKALRTSAPVVTVDALVAGVADDSPASPADAEIALVQFTSGSSGVARGIRVTFAGLAANVAAIGRWLAITPSDTTATWLPAYHDMGLVGCL